MLKWWLTAACLIMIGLAVSCAGQPAGVPEEPIVLEEPAREPVDEQPSEPTVVPRIELDTETPDDDVSPEPADTEPEPEPEPVSTTKDDDEPFVVTEELYVRTFEEVEKTIGILNEIIRDRDFELWKRYLTQTYIDEFSDPETLRARSQSPILQRNNIVLRSLEDYFTWVVAPSRANARLDDLEFINDDTVIAIMVVQGQPVILYQLKNADGIWKIDLF